MLTTLNGAQMRRINRAAIFEYIRTHSPTSRTEIANALQVSLPTVMRILEGLIQENLVLTLGTEEDTTLLGRKRELLQFNQNAFSVLAIDLGGTKLYAAIVNLAGQILLEHTLENHHTTGEATYQLLVESIQTLLDQSATLPPLKGIAIGVPGIAHPQSGIVQHAPSLNWHNFPLTQRIQSHFNLPTIVENDVNLSALGEFWFGAGRGTQNMLLIALGTGVGSGLILNGTLFRGAHQAAGEIGYFLTDREELGHTYDEFGAFENKTSGLGLPMLAQKNRALLNLPAQSLTSHQVFDAFQQAQPWAQNTLAEFIDLLTIAISNANTLLDLDCVVLSGGLSTQAPHFLPQLQQRLLGLTPHPPQIHISNLNRTSTVMGGIIKILHQVDDYVTITRLS